MELSKYTILERVKLLFSLLLTRMFYPGAKLIRQPFEIRNRKYIRIGKGFTTGKYCRLEAYPNQETKDVCIWIGDNVQINDSVHIVGSSGVTIGDNTLLAGKIFISDLNHGSYGTNDIHDSPDMPPQDRPLSSRKVHIGKNVWIGEFVSILPGVTIGDGAIIGTMSVVSKSIPANCIAVGSPAKVIKIFNPSSREWQKYKP
ncbi:hypothetical protein ACTJJB_17205 [Chitinophaga sp. 22536]|uniref:hypothetical protein n=1 Tax=unclassified Chitinophaga TaxID=2619133 RepID=UPI003F854B73